MVDTCCILILRDELQGDLRPGFAGKEVCLKTDFQVAQFMLVVNTQASAGAVV